MFSAPWCAACKIVAPILEGVAKDFDNMTFGKVDVSKNPGLASRYGVMSLPNILIFSKGKVADQIIGATSKSDIQNRLKKLA